MAEIENPEKPARLIFDFEGISWAAIIRKVKELI